MPRGLNSLDWEDKEFIAELEEQMLAGASARQLAAKYGKGHVHFAAMLRMKGYTRSWRNKTRNELMRKMYAEGDMTQKELGEKFGLKLSRTTQLTSAADRIARRREKVKELYLGDPNMHIDTIAEKVGMKRATIYTDLKALGLRI